MPPLLPPESCTIYTPEPLAGAMVKALRYHSDDLWLEPCVGQGALTRALYKIGVSKDHIIAVDLDRSKSPNDSLAKTLRGIEFLTWSQQTGLRFDKIAANPPYINLDRLDPAVKKAALRINGVDGTFISEGSNCWMAFLYACLHLLKPNGSLCFLLPAAWDYANYAAAARELLPKRFEYFEIHRSSTPLFENVQDGCVVIIGRGYEQTHRQTIRCDYESATELIQGLLTNTSYPQNEQNVQTNVQISTSSRREHTRALGDIIDIRLGGVTGDSKYFLLTERRRAELGLPVDCLRPVLSKSRHLTCSEMTQCEWDSLRDRGERVWLFDPPPRMLKHPSVDSYLNLPMTLGGCRRGNTKIQTRELWYRTILPKQVDGFISGMTKLGPWITFCRMPRLTATNTLYTIVFQESLTADQKAAWGLSLLASRRQYAVEGTARIYPQGLCKYEPSDLLRLNLQKIPSRVRGARDAYRRAVRLLLGGHIGESQAFAEGWLDSS
jgi:adenine-specific DNA-methyltransferase